MKLCRNITVRGGGTEQKGFPAASLPDIRMFIANKVALLRKRLHDDS